jgi:hypothetical protein
VWLGIFAIAFPIALFKSLKEGIWAAMFGAYVYFCIPMREFTAPGAPYAAMFWGLAILGSFRYAGMQRKWGSQDLLQVAQNAGQRAIEAIRDNLKNAVLGGTSNRESEAEIKRKADSLTEGVAKTTAAGHSPGVVREVVVNAVEKTRAAVIEIGLREAARVVEGLPGANSAQLRAAMNQRVAPMLDQALDEMLVRELEGKVQAAIDKAGQDGGAASEGNDPGDMPKPRSPVSAIFTNSGFWLFMGFLAMNFLGTQMDLPRPWAAADRFKVAKLLLIPMCAIMMSVRTDRHFKLFTYAWMFGVWQLSVQAGKKWITFGGRIDDVGGQGGEANFLGAIIVTVAPIAFGMIMVHKTKLGRNIGYIGAGGFVLGILACGSRGAMVALMGQMAYWLFFTTKKGKAWCLALAGVAAFLAVAPPEFMARMATIIEKKGGGYTKPKVEESKRERQELWKLAKRLYKENPVIGVGPNQYCHYSAQELPELKGAYSGTPGLMTHNSWLQILSEYGTIGSFFWMGAFFWSFLCFRKARKVMAGVEGYEWFPAYALGFEAGALGNALAITFSSFQWLDYLYWHMIFGPAVLIIARETRARVDWLRPVKPAEEEGDGSPLARKPKQKLDLDQLVGNAGAGAQPAAAGAGGGPGPGVGGRPNAGPPGGGRAPAPGPSRPPAGGFAPQGFGGGQPSPGARPPLSLPTGAPSPGARPPIGGPMPPGSRPPQGAPSPGARPPIAALPPGARPPPGAPSPGARPPIGGPPPGARPPIGGPVPGRGNGSDGGGWNGG